MSEYTVTSEIYAEKAYETRPAETDNCKHWNYYLLLILKTFLIT